ncbi:MULTISPECIES: CynX/NimT family MFS transporter [Pseudomonadaceae]|uniref:MFS transporter, CP family, cyanate transporter n=1 Tax=Pseudomonas oryzihabitans TaxID=47885 RepID=A0A1G5P201_9PSED|nr:MULTISPECIES: CynX/NimT family MFS transporter [Pseudomonas]SCZ43000.1 MFS transporter, CP family, cyanate transporter [Pseudomonas psychrotolerans]
MSSPASSPLTPWQRGLLLASLMLIALNLRPALSSLAPLLRQIETSTGLSSSAIGLLTTLPVLCLGLFAPLAPRLARRWGSERTLGAILALLAAGIVLRSLLPPLGLFLGSLIAGACIGILGVLLPALVKRDFPAQAGQLMGLYTMMLCIGAAVAAGATAPLAEAFDGRWQPALATWALVAVVALLVWLPQLRQPPTIAPRRGAGGSLWRNRLAWQITLYMGLQSSLAYIVFGWLPTLLMDRGLGMVQAGLMLSGSVMTQLVSALTAPWLATRGQDQRLAIVVVMSLTLAGLLGCLYAPVGSLWLWAVILGLGQGGTFSLALALLVLRSRDAETAGRLSGMAQGAGYSLASLGPLLVGIIHDATHGWAPMGVLFTLIAVLATLFGLGAGRTRYVNDV